MSATQRSPQNRNIKQVAGDIFLIPGVIACICCWLFVYELHSMRTVGFAVLFGSVSMLMYLTAGRKRKVRILACVIICFCAIAGYIFVSAMSGLMYSYKGSSQATIRGIGQSMALYEQDFNCRPNNLDELLKVGLDPKLLISPFSGLRYEYINLPEDAPDELVRAYDPSQTNGYLYAISPNNRYVSILFHDGSVKLCSQAYFDKVLKKTKEFMAEYSGGQ